MRKLPNCVLQTGRMDTWQFSLEQCPSWAFPLLTHEEQARAKRYHFAKDQRRFTVARAILRVIIAHYVQNKPEDLTFIENKHGKPYLTNNPKQLQFNLSHSQDSALLGISQVSELGVDIEYFSKRPFLGIANHVFSPAEIAGLTKLPEQEQVQTFYTIWAQKEAFIKATGMGLSYPLKELTVPLQNNSDCFIIDKLTAKSWRLLSFMPEPNCCAALCVDPSIMQISHYQLSSIEDLHES